MTYRLSVLTALAFGVGALSAEGCGDGEPRLGGQVDGELSETEPGKQLVLGRAHGCSLDPAISGVICWGDNARGQAKVPLLNNPRYIAAGGDVSCAIAGGDVRCWGDDSHRQLAVPRGLRRPTQVAVGAGHVCALTASGAVRCWGDNSHGQLDAPALEGVRAIGAGARHSCALTAAGVSCWGDRALGQLDVPALAEPTQLAVGASHNCVIDGGQVVCWGGEIPALLDQIPAVTEATAIAAGSAHSCVVASGAVQCWGDAIAGGLAPRELTNATQVAVGGGGGRAHACARHQQGVACWGDNQRGQTAYSGDPWHMLYRAESEIAAPPELIWDILMDLDGYPDWNPYTIAMESTLQVGDPMVMQVKMNELLTIEQIEHIRVLEDGHKVCWGIETTTPELNTGERCQWLEPLPDGGTRYVTEDLIEGTLNPLVILLFGEDVQTGFDRVARALKKHAEALNQSP